MEHHIRMGATRDGKLTALLHEGWEVTSRTDIGADLHANRSLIEISRNFDRFVEVKYPLGLLQWYAVLPDNLADWHGIRAVRRIERDCVAPRSLDTVIFRTVASAAIP